MTHYAEKPEMGSDKSIILHGETIEINFKAPFDLKAYKIFLQSKQLPECNLSYDWQTDRYQLKTPSRFAHLFGLQDIQPQKNWLLFNPQLFDYELWIVRDLALPAKRFAIWCDCVAGETEIEMPTGRTSIKELCEIGQPISVWALDGNGNRIEAPATAPFCKGYGEIYEFTTASGKSIRVMPGHRFLTPLGWVRAGDLRIGDVLSSSSFLPQSNSATAPSKFLEDGQHFFQKLEDLKDHYCPLLRPYDQQPHAAINSGQGPAPLQDDVPGPVHLLWRKDDQGHKSGHNHLRHNICHLSRQDYVRRDNCISGALESHAFSWRSKELPYCSPTPLRFFPYASPIRSTLGYGQCEDQGWRGGQFLFPLEGFPYVLGYLHAALPAGQEYLSSQVPERFDLCANPPQSICGFGQQMGQSGSFSAISAWTPPLNNDELYLDTLVSIKFIRKDFYYDIHVPGYENYLAPVFWAL